MFKFCNKNQEVDKRLTMRKFAEGYWLTKSEMEALNDVLHSVRKLEFTQNVFDEDAVVAEIKYNLFIFDKTVELSNNLKEN